LAVSLLPNYIVSYNTFIEPDDLQKLIRECPLLIRMNDGREVYVEKPEFITVGDTAGVLYDDSGVKRNTVISIINITSVIPIATPPRTKRRRKSS
jgi:hypothetical protein